MNHPIVAFVILLDQEFQCQIKHQKDSITHEAEEKLNSPTMSPPNQQAEPEFNARCETQYAEAIQPMQQLLPFREVNSQKYFHQCLQVFQVQINT